MGRRGFDAVVLQVIGFERFFEVISASFASLALGVLIKLDRMLLGGVAGKVKYFLILEILKFSYVPGESWVVSVGLSE